MKYSILLMLIFWTGIKQAQSEVNISRQIWLDANPAYYFTPHQQIYGDIGIRRELENKGWWRLVVRPSFRAWLGSIFYLSAGVGNFFTYNETIENRWEIRPFQGLNFRWPRWQTPVSHYIRLEERFDFNVKSWQSKNSMRLRYQLGTSYRWAALQPGRFWQATANMEAFLTLTGQQGQFQEQARATLGLDRSYANDLRIRFEVTWQQERLFFNTSENASDIYFRFRVYRNWGDY